MTFKNWIIKFKDVNLPIGDLAKDIDSDKHFPDTKDHDTMLEYLEKRNAYHLAIETFERSYRFYQEEISF
ncbi:MULTISPECIES: YozE family protein [unclassified Oceanobacillus]|uniref:YozE family protein n=1 Tax=unclassified Oceanobacillus TaxID=2630292 RepID=UPI001BE523DD|nr:MULTISPECIES: YozE family protein [unclassified Oceanobacillus]MBT2600913.1 hypothetical protein [Oceanobacillus sp. ISL-74]MBT2653426.1 hypothetical protein [Oceanobacillus sp. ISL-73]